MPYSYGHNFWVLPKRDDSVKLTDYFTVVNDIPWVMQTIFLDDFYVNHPTMFLQSVSHFIETALHEGRHLFQHYTQKSKKLPGSPLTGDGTGTPYGGPKSYLSHKHAPEIRGTTFGGTATPTSPVKEPDDPEKRVLHPFRDVEFKTNQYNYKKDIESILGSNYVRKDWPAAFKDLMRYTTGNMDYATFQKKFRHNSFQYTYSVAYNHLKNLYKNDREKFNQMVRELYKLIFA